MQWLNSEEIKESLRNKINSKNFDTWYTIVEPILLNQEFQVRRLFRHHDKSVWDHSIDVSYYAFCYAKIVGANERICAIGGLLHDFYPFAWRYSKALEEYDNYYLSRLKKKEFFLKKHGFTHAREAYQNYLKYFSEYEDKKISDCIIKHMFPLNIKIPKYRESWIVTFADKRVSISDFSIKKLRTVFK